MTLRDIVFLQLKRYEDFRPTIYKDSVGKWTIGYGVNLSDGGITRDEGEYLLENRIEIAIEVAEKVFLGFDTLNDIRKAVLVNMAYNLGQTRLRQFIKMIHAVQDGDFKEASKQMLNSKWASQVGQRAIDLANMMRDGV